MKTRKQRIRTTLIVGMLLVGQCLLHLIPCTSSAQPSYEAYYNYLGNHPDEKWDTGWSSNTQGLTHDQDNWYITQDEPDRLWKIPVTKDLDGPLTYNNPGPDVLVKVLDETDMYDLWIEGYDHMGDLSYHEGYVLVPLEGGPQPAIAAFRADTLQYVGHDYLDVQNGAGWCAIDPEGYVYSSSSQNVIAIWKYSVDWEKLLNDEELVLTRLLGFEPLYDENGNYVTPIKHMQGGVFSPGGALLYIVSGYYDDPQPTDGIHVFDTSTRRRVQRSTNGYGYFNYEFHQAHSINEEPEGLTIWDLDDGRAPNIRGHLHVLLVDQDLFHDDVYIKHYTHSINVDRDHTGSEQGTPSQPFNTVGEATDHAWTGAQIKIKAGLYPEVLTFSKPTEVVSDGGLVTIGQ